MDDETMTEVESRERETEALPEGLPAEIRKLPGEHLADVWSGRAVPRDEVVAEVSVRAKGRLPRNAEEASARSTLALLRHAPEQSETVTLLAVGPETAALKAAAGDLLERFPALSERLGSVAREHLEEALAAVAMLGASLPPLRSSREALEVVERLQPWGRSALWSSRYSVFLDPDALPRQCAREPWAHVRAEIRKGARQAYSEILADRALGPTRTVPVPPGSEWAGCLVCGVGSVEVPRSALETAWRPANVAITALGGRGGEMVRGYLCSTCQGAHDEVGAFGLSLMEESILRCAGARRMPGTDRASLRLDNAKAWAVAAVDRSRPNVTPWAHVPNLDEVVEWLSTGTLPAPTTTPNTFDLAHEVEILRTEVATLRANAASAGAEE